MTDWYGLKLAVVQATGLSRDLLHVFMGVGAMVLAALVLRRPLSSPLPWAALLIAELANEAYDLHREAWLDRPMWPASIRDLLVTMAIPTALLLLTRLAPGLFAPPRRGKGK